MDCQAFNMSKRTYEKAFERKFLKEVKSDDFYVKIDMYKVNRKNYRDSYTITTTENNNFTYDSAVITKRSKSAKAFDREEVFTKTELIELFAILSPNDVWSAQYHTYDKTNEWQKKLAETIQSQTVAEASMYIKKNFGSFGKIDRMIVGHKISQNSNNNYYMVRDLKIHFDLLNDGKSVDEAHHQSIRNLDVNSLQFLIFNGVKYVLKK